MSQPVLIIVAGCNGAGKSRYSKALVRDSLVPFDYDKRFKEIYSSLIDSEFREVIAKNMTTEEFETAIKDAFSQGKDFCYETNFDSHPLYWVKMAKEHGYSVSLHFFCLTSIDLAQQRVSARVRRNGHFVSDEIIFYKWKEGYKNLNKYYVFFDHVLMIENSSSESPLEYLFSLIKEKDDYIVRKHVASLPNYSSRRFPNIYALVKSK